MCASGSPRGRAEGLGVEAQPAPLTALPASRAMSRNLAKTPAAVRAGGGQHESLGAAAALRHQPHVTLLGCLGLDRLQLPSWGWREPVVRAIHRAACLSRVLSAHTGPGPRSWSPHISPWPSRLCRVPGPRPQS